MVQNSIVQTYAEEKNKDVTSQQFLDYIKDLKQKYPNFTFEENTVVYNSLQEAQQAEQNQKQQLEQSIKQYEDIKKQSKDEYDAKVNKYNQDVAAYNQAKQEWDARLDQIDSNIIDTTLDERLKIAEWFAQEKDLVGIKKDKNSSIEYTLFYSNNGSLSEIIKLKYSIPITVEIDKQMIDGYIYSISDLLTYNAPCKI